MSVEIPRRTSDRPFAVVDRVMLLGRPRCWVLYIIRLTTSGVTDDKPTDAMSQHMANMLLAHGTHELTRHYNALDYATADRSKQPRTIVRARRPSLATNGSSSVAAVPWVRIISLAKEARENVWPVPVVRPPCHLMTRTDHVVAHSKCSPSGLCEYAPMAGAQYRFDGRRQQRRAFIWPSVDGQFLLDGGAAGPSTGMRTKDVERICRSAQGNQPAPRPPLALIPSTCFWEPSAARVRGTPPLSVSLSAWLLSLLLTSKIPVLPGSLLRRYDVTGGHSS
ncbi:hypothetical protein CSOJ01_05211 [Colletotrichum sojae]|uniref:Uncharacterized protein n=1 Tax=Colletotrichum sojae TaxID=2175907 RepID=A0A8H6MXY8_9PEZI|nr:hypothetical protein CSOJ01_05211 [Colletotrichum sojae]